MSDYFLNIIDTTDSSHVTSLEQAEKNSIVLSYAGKDIKDALDVVGSSLAFNIAVEYDGANTDGAFLDLFTGDENKYKIELRKDSDSTLLWNGFILPDSYKEPYKNGTFFVNFQAVDGLGRLKGKFLPDTFYETENSVTAYIAECLKLTGLSMNLYFSPAIAPSNNQAYHQIYIDGTNFVSRNRKDDAHKILQTLAQDMLCCVFQHVGKWYFEGLNKRNLLSYEVKEYDTDGAYVQDLQLTRNVKVINDNTLVTPLVTMIAPYNIITVTHEREPADFPATIDIEENDGWVNNAGENGEIYATDWEGNDGFYAFATAPDYNVRFYNNETNAFDSDKYVSLKDKIYLNKGDKYKLSLKVKVVTTEANEQFEYTTSWSNPIRYDVLINGTVYFSNYQDNVTNDEALVMNNTQEDDAAFEFLMPEDGLLDVKFYQPYITGEYITAVELIYLKLDAIGFTDEEIFTDTISDDYTIDYDKELTFADDPTGFSKAFRLAKLKEIDAVVNTITVDILYSFTQNDTNYSVVALKGANLISDNPENVEHNSSTLSDFSVIYNYQNGEQMLIQHELSLPLSASTFEVDIYSHTQVTGSRLAWKQFTDDVYGIEQERYATCVANVIRRMFKVPHQKVELSLTKMPVAFTDIVKWQYVSPSNYFVTNLTWNLDSGTTSLVLNKAIYQNDDTINPGDNLPPLVTATSPIYITAAQTSVNLTSNANDPDGFITAYAWTQTAGTSVNIVSPNSANTAITTLSTSDSYWTFQIEVTDNDGATATAAVEVIRLDEYTLSWSSNRFADNTDVSSEGEEFEEDFDLVCTPALPDNFNLTLNCVANITITSSGEGDEFAYGKLTLIKNTVTLETYTYTQQDFNSSGDVYFSVPLVFNYNNTDSIEVEFVAEAYYEPPETTSPIQTTVQLIIESVDFATGQGTVAGIPATAELVADAPP